ncbi:hypothetical protein C8J57DRAFT_1672626 [Mycena rebaudengoi]|nr:hypothetical protein C8J57DRAFT_1672626 [Mycena rebaudengoi]
MFITRVKLALGGDGLALLDGAYSGKSLNSHFILPVPADDVEIAVLNGFNAPRRILNFSYIYDLIWGQAKIANRDSLPQRRKARAPSGTANSCAINTTSTCILGNQVQRSVALFLDCNILALPYTLILPMGLFFALFSTYRKLRQRWGSNIRHSNSLHGLLALLHRLSQRSRSWYQRLHSSPSIAPILSSWTFGQTLAILLLVLPLLDIVGTMLARREKARLEKVARREKAHQEEVARGEKVLAAREKTRRHLYTLRTTADLDVIRDLVKNGADPNAVADSGLQFIHFGVAIELCRRVLNI